jgi:hypothetical protein
MHRPRAPVPGPRSVSDVAPKFYPAAIGVGRLMNCSPSLDRPARVFPAAFAQGGPCATDRSTSSIGALLPIAL